MEPNPLTTYGEEWPIQEGKVKVKVQRQTEETSDFEKPELK